MALHVIHAELYLIIIKTSSILFTLMYLALFLYHIASTHKRNGSVYQMKGEKKFAVSLFLTFILFFFGIICVVMGLLISFMNIQDSAICSAVTHTAISSYSGFKFLLYLILILKLQSFYDKICTMFELDALYLILKIWTVLLPLWSALNLYLSNYHYLVPPEICHEILKEAKPSLISIGGEDIVAMLINAYLFTKPLLLVRNYVGIHNHKTSRFKSLAQKQWILSIIAVSSTIFALFGVFLFDLPQLFIAIDINISSLSLIAMYVWNKWMIQYCCKLIKCSICSRNRERSAADLKSLEIVIDDAVNKQTISSNNDAMPISVPCHGSLIINKNNPTTSNPEILNPGSISNVVTKSKASSFTPNTNEPTVNKTLSSMTTKAGTSYNKTSTSTETET